MRKWKENGKEKGEKSKERVGSGLVVACGALLKKMEREKVRGWKGVGAVQERCCGGVRCGVVGVGGGA
jgi:hypothetical protein